MTSVTVTLYDEPCTLLLLLLLLLLLFSLNPFYYFEFPNNFCKEFENIFNAQSVL